MSIATWMSHQGNVWKTILKGRVPRQTSKGLRVWFQTTEIVDTATKYVTRSFCFPSANKSGVYTSL